MMAYEQDSFGPFSTRWPKNSDRLFRTNATVPLAQSLSERWYRLILGYKRAGDLLIKEAVENRLDRRNLLYPIIFCYRHYLELTLKAMLDEHAGKVDFVCDRNHHDLKKLWTDFKAMVERGGDVHPENFVAMDAIIAEFATIDPQAISFRYAAKSTGAEIYLPDGGVDLINLHDVMNGMANWLECVDLALTHESWPSQ
ncbi:MAG: hypothetical protein KGJ66_09560 [Alphaproteobacteria bacterium]|nr:hypothetical protein [Alphaproteobacteria bacterium]